MSNVESKRLARVCGAPLRPLPKAPRFILLPGAYNASGEPLIGWVTGNPCQPDISTFRMMSEALAAKAALHAQGGGA